MLQIFFSAHFVFESFKCLFSYSLSEMIESSCYARKKKEIYGDRDGERLRRRRWRYGDGERVRDLVRRRLGLRSRSRSRSWPRSRPRSLSFSRSPERFRPL